MAVVKTGKDFTGFLMLRDRRCGAATRVEVGTGFWSGYGPDGKVLTQDVGDIITKPYGTSVLTYAACKGCGRLLNLCYGKGIYGSYSERHICAGACVNAVGPDCECSCAGANHGSGH